MSVAAVPRSGDLRGLLDGVRVLDLSRVLAGPFGAMLLAEMGADVVKVEFPSGDPVRALGPHLGERSLYFSAVNTGKRGIVLDPSRPAERTRLERLLGAADVVVENYRRDAARALELDPAALRARHPHLVIVTVSGYARDSSRGREAAYDVSIQAEAGVMSVTGTPGGPPLRAGVPLADLAGGMYAALAAASGLVARARRGEGVHVEVPLLDATLPLLSYMATAAAEAGLDPPPVSSGHHRIVPYGAYEAQDGWLVLAVLADKFWLPLCDALDLTTLRDRDDLAHNAERLAAREEVDHAVATAIAARSVDTSLAALRGAGVPVAPVLGLTGAMVSGYAAERGMVRRIEAPEGAYTVVQGPLRASGTDRPAPSLGEHTDEVLRAWGAHDDVEQEIDGKRETSGGEQPTRREQADEARTRTGQRGTGCHDPGGPLHPG